MKFNIEYTDTFSGEANYSWVERATIAMPELTHYGYELGISFTGLDGRDHEVSELVEDLASAKRILTDMEERGAKFISASLCKRFEDEIAVYEIGAWHIHKVEEDM